MTRDGSGWQYSLFEASRPFTGTGTGTRPQQWKKLKWVVK